MSSYRGSGVAALLLGLSMCVAFTLAQSADAATTVFSTEATVSGIDVAPSGDVYVADASSQPVGALRVLDASGAIAATWGSNSGPNGIGQPTDVALDSAGNAYVTDRTRRRVQVYGPAGNLVTQWGNDALGCPDSGFEDPQGIAIDANDNVYVVDSRGACVQKFSSAGTFITKWGTSGTEPGQFTEPLAIDVDSTGNVYVTDSPAGVGRVQVFSPTGQLLRTWSTGDTLALDIELDGSDQVYVAGTDFGRYTKVGDPRGEHEVGPTPGATSLGSDDQGNVYASFGQTIYKVDPSTPAATVESSADTVSTGDQIRLDATGSYSPFDRIRRFEWDVDGDGSYELDTGEASTTAVSYAAAGVRTIRVRVTGPSGATAAAEATVDVRTASSAGPPGVSINGGSQFTNDPAVTVDARWPLFAQSMVLSNDGGFVPYSEVPVAAKVDWRLDSSGPERLPKTIYVRFRGGSAGAETYQDDIILDETAPVVRATLVSSEGKKGRVVARPRPVSIRIKASDKTSGVESMQVAGKRTNDAKWVSYRSRSRVKSSSGKVFVRVQDRAGNVSGWRRAE